MYLNQLLEEYKETDMPDEIINRFLQRLWGSKYIFKKYKKYYKYKVNEELLDNRQDLIDLFNKYSIVEYTVCKSFYKNKKINSIDYIRIHINNMYGYLFDKEVYYNNEYYKLLLTPKKEYFRIIKIKKQLGNLDSVNYQELKGNIENALYKAGLIKQESINKKHNLKFKDYKKIINTYFERIFNNYISTEEYEEKYGWDLNIKVDGWSEDNYAIKYFCKSLTGYMRNYIRNSKIKPKVCLICGRDIPNRNTYCNDCYEDIRKNNRKIYNKKYYNKIKNS